MMTSPGQQRRSGTLASSKFGGWVIRIAFKLSPPHFGEFLANEDLVEKRRGLFQAIFHRHQAIFMLDRNHAIVPDHGERRDEIVPEVRPVAEAHSTKHPGAFGFITVGL